MSAFPSCVRRVVGCGIAGALFRISFSANKPTMIAISWPAMRQPVPLLLERATALGGLAAYRNGTLNVLRIEKRVLTNAEMDGRTTAFDLGWRDDLVKEGFARQARRPSRSGRSGPSAVGGVKTMSVLGKQ